MPVYRLAQGHFRDYQTDMACAPGEDHTVLAIQAQVGELFINLTGTCT